jgi:predicted DNA binding protein
VATVSVTTGSERLETLVEAIRAAGHDLTVAALHSTVATAGPLTDRRETVLRRALSAGYYETPREADLADLADELGVCEATVSETLRRAEGAVAEHLLADPLSVGGLAARPTKE